MENKKLVNGVFLDNKYTAAYYKIVQGANKQNRRRGDGNQYESHHVLPKCMGGKDNDWNRVLLTAREHFVTHALLVKMTEGKQSRRLSSAIKTFEPGYTSYERYYNGAMVA